jgi:hypothetical protein
MWRDVSRVTSCDGGQSIVVASVVQFRDSLPEKVLLEESPVEHANCEGTTIR